MYGPSYRIIVMEGSEEGLVSSQSLGADMITGHIYSF